MRVVVPFRAGCAYRDLAWELCRQWWVDRGVDPVESDDGGDVFSRGMSINQAVEGLSDDEIVVAADADVILEWDALVEAVDLAVQPGLVQPFDRTEHLDATWTRTEWEFEPSSSTPLLGAVNVFSVETWRRAGGFLPAFRGWGCEDVAFAHQCALTSGPLRRVGGALTHLWHPKHDNDVNWDGAAIMRRVTAARTADELEEVIRGLPPA